MLPAVLRPLRPCAIAASGVPFRYGTCVARTSSLVGTYQRAGAVTSTFLAPLARLERATRCLEGSRSIQLSYRGFGGNCPTGPLRARFRSLVGASGFEEVAGVAARFVVGGDPLVDVILVTLDEHHPAVVVVGRSEVGVVVGG